MKINISLHSATIHFAVAWLFSWIDLCQGFLPQEFGNVLHQEMKTVKQTDSDVQTILQFVTQYARKRYPWSVPRSLSQHPSLSHLRKKILVYTHDGSAPLFFDDAVTDRTGNQYGISRFITLGTIFSFLLSWQETMIKFCHNFTVSVYPKDHINIYTHTFFLQNINTTNQKETHTRYMFPKVGESYFKYFTEGEKVGEFSYMTDFAEVETGDIYSTDSLESNKNNNAFTSKTFFNNPKGEIKVMTYNIWNMNSKTTKAGGYTERMLRLKQIILKADPDILALQEVRYEDAKGEDLGPSQIHTLSDWFPHYQYVYQPAQMQPNTLQDGRTEEGVAIMSKYPIISHSCHMLFINRSNSADTHQRVLLQADIYFPSIGMIHILTTHLSLSHEAREHSVVQIWKLAKALQGPVILMGDLNAEPREPAMQYLSGKKVFPGEERSMLMDVWSKFNLDTDKGYTFNALEKNLTKRIDYIFFKPWEDCCQIKTCKILDDGKRGYKAASDHVPVMATLVKPSKSKLS